MNRLIEKFLDNITMYRLVEFICIGLILWSIVASSLGIMKLDPVAILISSGFLVGVSIVSNKILAKIWGAVTNVESTIITALILALIINPITKINDLWFLFWAALLSMATKYILAVKSKHIFNPAAIAVFLTAMGIGQTASWWVGTRTMLPLVLIGSFLIIKKIRRWDLAMSFLGMALLTISIATILKGQDLFKVWQFTLIDSPLIFFMGIMLTEPLTTPPKSNLRKWYGALTGFLYAPQLSFGGFYTTPEIALLAGNVWSFLVSPKEKMILELEEKIWVAPDVMDFVFRPNQKMKFTPGQYMEWTLPLENADNRGNRRYLTIASSPTEETLRLGVKFYDKPSAFKKTMQTMKKGDKIVAAQLSGDFVMPKDKTKKLVFIAGGIGVTPFRSMVKYLNDTGEKRDVVMIYSNKTKEEIVYKEIFDGAKMKTVYVLTDKEKVPSNWMGKVGRIDAAMIEKEIPDFKERIFYISGPQMMVLGTEETLTSMGVTKSNLVTDYFPGLA